jgi:transposase
MKIIHSILDGIRDVNVLANHRDRRCKASSETVRKALGGNYRSEHVFALRQALELYKFHRAKVDECDIEIEAALAELNIGREVPAAPLPALRHARNPSEPKFELRGALYTLLGADLSQIHGFGAHTVLRLIGECGDDMRKWPTVKHFTSWLCLAPGNKISGGRGKTATTFVRRTGETGAPSRAGIDTAHVTSVRHPTGRWRRMARDRGRRVPR